MVQISTTPLMQILINLKIFAFPLWNQILSVADSNLIGSGSQRPEATVPSDLQSCWL